MDITSNQRIQRTYTHLFLSKKKVRILLSYNYSGDEVG